MNIILFDGQGSRQEISQQIQKQDSLPSIEQEFVSKDAVVSAIGSFTPPPKTQERDTGDKLN